MKLTIIETGLVPEAIRADFVDYPEMFRDLISVASPDMEFETVSVIKGEALPDPSTLEGILITGSPAGVYDDFPWIAPLEDFIRGAAKAGVPQVGICFGHQMVAEALGGKTSPADAGWCVGVHTIEPTTDAAAYGLSDSAIHLRSNHKDQVTKLPPGGKVLASTETCPIASMGLGEHILTFQGHPEFSEEYARALLNMRREIFGEELYQSAINSLETETDNPSVARHIVEFVSRSASESRQEY